MSPALYSAAIGLLACEIFTHPKRRLRKALPRLKVGFLEIFPCIRIHGKTHTLHIHHWLFFPVILLASIPLNYPFLDSHTTRGFLIGGAIQGFLINRKARRLIYKNPLEVSDQYR
ncbi:hypothetical protein A3D85_03560 [Candidatus Amesbacteria bacterium RIFCSPHIGHO2_02_FULL_47_9]|nr:MAG: hypothetical protein A3D85_03560 [Candidatus Amesbacteria bacterium RIFCSPHIGHO2_02_FULL_47_9]